MRNGRRLIQGAIAAVVASAGAGAAHAERLIPLPHNLEMFTTSGGIVNPEVLVGFNPQPDPPGDVARADLSNPLMPSIAQTGAGPFTILFGLRGPYRFHEGAFSVDAVTGDGSVDVLAIGDGSAFKISLDVAGYASDWASFNPQPEPPGFGSNFAFSFTGDPVLTFSMEGGRIGPGDVFIDGAAMSFAAVPEPAAAALLGLGLLGLTGLRRRG